jgi:hypothetical protein
VDGTAKGRAIGRWSMLVGWLAASACSSSEGTTATALVRDSAGVSVVENASVPLHASAGWALSPEPLVDVGVLQGEPEYQLFRVRDAVRFDDGSIVVLNGGSSELRVFGGDGVHLYSFGSEGEGPGEYVRPTIVTRWPGDSLAVWDASTGRLTISHESGELGRTLPLGWDAGASLAIPAFSHLLDDGNLVVFSLRFPETELGTGVHRPNIAVRIVDPTGELVADMGDHPGDETYMNVGDGTVEVMRLPFARSYVLGAAGTESIIGGTDRWELRYWDAGGVLSRIVRIAEPPRLNGPEHMEARLAERLEGVPEERRAAVRASVARTPGPDTLPAFEIAGTDALGNTWVKPFRSPADSGPDHWIALDDQGVVLGRIEVPEDVELYEIGADYALGLWTDELDVEHVRVWSLTRE